MGEIKKMEETLEAKTPFIDKAVACANVLKIAAQSVLIGVEVPRRAAFVVAVDDSGEGDQPQAVIAGLGNSMTLELAAEALINHPQFGHLIIAKVMDKVINTGELTAEIVEIPKSKKGDATVN